MKKEQYISPFTREVTMLESHGLVCVSIDQKNVVLVDPLDETGKYYDGTESTSDYLIKF